MQVSPYEVVAQSFLDEYPVDTVFSAAELQDWVKGHADGVMIKPDLAILDPAKRIQALLRHLNHGGRSSNIAEDRRFQIKIEDTVNQTYVVMSHAKVVEAKADAAFSKSVSGALSPLRTSKAAIDGVKLDELPELQRQTLEIARENIAAIEKAIKPTLASEIKRVWTAKLAQRGVSADQAMKLLESMPEVLKLQKLIKATK